VTEKKPRRRASSAADKKRQSKVEWKLKEPLTPEAWIEQQGVDSQTQNRFLRESRSDDAQNLWRRYRAERFGRGVGLDGATFIQEDVDVEPVWGDGPDVLIARGEPTLLAGPQGVGKSTVAQQYALHRIGIYKGPMLGYSVTEAYKVFYLAMDRPPQIRRSLRRMVQSEDAIRAAKEHLHVWRGALPVDPAHDPELFAEWVQEEGDGPDELIIDSYKDVGGGALSDEEVGYNINRAAQLVSSYGTQWLGLHHHRKAQGAGKPNRMDDIYGSAWLTSGCGSVLQLWGDPGSATVELSHLKQPMNAVGPLLVNHAHTDGVSTAVDPEDRLLQTLRSAGEQGVTEAAAAMAIWKTADSTHKKRARRLLDRLMHNGELRFEAGQRGGPGGGAQRPARWWLI